MANNPAINSVRPLFVRSRDLPDSQDKPYTVREICSHIETVAGHGTMDGAQLIGGLWRLYPTSLQARRKILVDGFSLRGVVVSPLDKNPYLVTGNAGENCETTRLVIGNVQLSFSNEDIEKKIAAIGCTLASKLKYECDMMPMVS